MAFGNVRGSVLWKSSEASALLCSAKLLFFDAESRKISKSKLLAVYSRPRQGLATADNEQFVRYWFEISNSNFERNANNAYESTNSKRKWYPYNKGGYFRKWYGMNEYVIDWFNNGQNLKAFNQSVLRNEQYYFQKGITWSLFGFENFGVRYKHNGFIFDVSGSSMFPDDNMLYYILAF